MSEEAAPQTSVAVSALIAYALLGLALWRSDGHRDDVALVLVLAATLLASFGMFGKGRFFAPLKTLLLVVALAQLAALAIVVPGRYLSPGTSLLPFRLGLLGVLLLTLLYVPRRGPIPTLRFPLLLALFLALGAWLIRSSPAPFIDVWYAQRWAVDHLLHLQNPYAAMYPNVYSRGAPYGGRWMSGDAVSPIFFGSNLEGGKVVSHQYPPLSILATVPGVLLGDPRWSQLVALGLAAVGLVVLARQPRGCVAGEPLELLALLFLFHPRSFFLLEMSWTEPLVALALVALFVAVARGRRIGVALAALLSIKQYAVFCLPALLAGGLVGRRSLWRGVAMAAALALPFVLWDPLAFWRGVVTFQFRVGLRPDALSVPAWLLVATGHTFASAAVGTIAASAAAWATAVRLRKRGRRPDLAALAMAVVFLILFVLNKQAFFNYYWFAGVLLLLAIVPSSTAAQTPGTESP